MYDTEIVVSFSASIFVLDLSNPLLPVTANFSLVNANVALYKRPHVSQCCVNPTVKYDILCFDGFKLLSVLDLD